MHLTILSPKDFNKTSLGKKSGKIVGFLVRVISFICRTIIYGSFIKAINFIYKIHLENMEILSVYKNCGFLTKKQKKTKFPIYLLFGVIVSFIFLKITTFDMDVKVIVIMVILFITLMMDLTIESMRIMGQFSDDLDKKKYNGPL